MDNFDSIIGEYKSGSPRSLEIISLVEDISNRKSLRFKESEIKDQYPILCSLGILHKDGFIVNGIDIGIKEDSVFYYALAERFSKSFSCSIPTDLENILIFCDQVGRYFEGAKAVVRLYKGLLKFLVRYAVFCKSYSLQKFAKQFLEEPVGQDFYWLFEVYFEIVSSMHFPDDEVWEILKLYTGKIGPPKSNTYDLNWDKIVQFCREYLNDNNQNSFKTLAFSDLNDSLTERLAMIILHLLVEKKYIGIKELTSLLDSDFKTKTFSLLKSVDTWSIDLMEKALLEFEALDMSAFKTTDALPVLVKIFSQATLLLDQGLVIRCKFLIESFIEGEDFELLAKAIYDLSETIGNDEYVLGLLIKCLHSEIFDYRVLNFCKFFFVKKKNLQNLISFLKEYCVINTDSQIIIKSFGEVMTLIKENNEMDFEREILLMMIDDFGAIRKLGHKIYFSHEIFYRGRRSTFNLLQFDFLQQYKLAISLLIKICPIGETIPLVSSLLKSDSGIIRELVLTKLEELIVDFKRDVLTLLNVSMDQTFIDRDEIIGRLQFKLDEVRRNNTLKSKIKEFDPTVTNAYQMRKYLDGYFKKTQEQVSKAESNHGGILQFTKNVKVARGGGMILPDGTIQPLIKASASFTIPSTMFLTPEVYDYQLIEFFSNNWKTEFESWEQIILLSGNI